MNPTITQRISPQQEAETYLDSIWNEDLKSKNIFVSDLLKFIKANGELLSQSKDASLIAMKLNALREKVALNYGYNLLIDEITKIVNKIFKAYDNEVEKTIPLKYSGATRGDDAIDYAIHHRLNTIDLRGYSDLKDVDLERLLDNCPDIQRLYIYSKSITDKCSAKIASLSQLKHLDMTAATLHHLDLRNCKDIVTVNLMCPCLETLILPDAAPDLQIIKILECTKLSKFILPNNAPMFRYITCLLSHEIRQLVLPKIAPSLIKVDFFDCRGIEELIFPEEIPALNLVKLYALSRIKELRLPANAPALQEFNFTASHGLSSLILPKNAPKLVSISLAVCEKLSYLELPETAPLLSRINKPYCENLKLESALHSKKYAKFFEVFED